MASLRTTRHRKQDGVRPDVRVEAVSDGAIADDLSAEPGPAQVPCHDAPATNHGGNDTRRRPRVLHVAAVDFTARRLLLPQLEDLATRGYDVRLSCGLSPRESWGELAQFHPADIAFPRAATKSTELATSIRKLVALIREWQPDIVHLHSPAAALPVRLLPRSARHGAKLVYTVHGYPHQWGRGPRELSLERLERVLAARTDLMLFQSQEDLDESRRRGYRSALRFLGNGVGAEWFAQTPRRIRTGDQLRVAYVGRVVHEKGVVELMRAVAAEPNVHLTVVGDALDSDRDSAMADLRSITATTTGLQRRVVYTGMLQPSAVRGVLAEADVFCLPSYREGIPRSLIEAMAMGLPSIATNIRGCRELLADGGGFLIPPRSVDALRAALRRIDQLSPAALQAVGNEARALVDPERRESSVFERVASAYEEIGVWPLAGTARPAGPVTRSG